MSVELISIVALIAIFVIATVLPVHMGALALVAAFIVGTTVVGESTDDIVAGFPGDLFLILVGVRVVCGGLRVSEEQERIGLDQSVHGENAYNE